jgi:hypothetical protein
MIGLGARRSTASPGFVGLYQAVTVAPGRMPRTRALAALRFSSVAVRVYRELSNVEARHERRIAPRPRAIRARSQSNAVTTRDPTR